MLNVFNEFQLNNTQFLFNDVNIFVIIKLLVFLMKFNVIKIKDIVIRIFYCAQLKIYMINLRKLIFDHSRLINIMIKTMNKMQKDKIKFVILNLMIHDHLNFLKLRNQINVFCFWAMNDMYFVENVTSIMMFQSKHRFHFDNLFIYYINQDTRILNVQTRLIENSISVKLKTLIAF